MLTRDKITGVVLLLGALAIFLVARGFPTPAGITYGADFFPNIIASGLALSGVLILATAQQTHADQTDKINGTAHGLRILALVVAIACYALTLEYLGFLLATPVLLFAMCLLFKGSLKTALLLAVAGTVLMHLIFYKVMKVPLPWGLLEPWSW